MEEAAAVLRHALERAEGAGGYTEKHGREAAAASASTAAAATAAVAAVAVAVLRSSEGTTAIAINSSVSVAGCGWDGAPRRMGSMLISEVAAWAGPRRAGDNAPVAAAMAVAERVTAAAVPAAAAAWASAGSVASATALGAALAGCLGRHAAAVAAAADAVAGPERNIDNDDNRLAALAEEPSHASTYSDAFSVSDDAYSGGGGGGGGGGGIAALATYLAATGHRDIPNVQGGVKGSGADGPLHNLLGSCGVCSGYAHLGISALVAMEAAAAEAERNWDTLTYDDAAEALDWLCRALSVPVALRASQRGVAAVAATLVEKLAARVGKEQAKAAAALQIELGAVSAGVRSLCDVLDLTPEAFPGRAGVVDAWAPEGLVSKDWGAEFTEKSLAAMVEALGGGGSAEVSSGSPRDTVAWDTLVNLALWLDEEAGWWWWGQADIGRHVIKHMLKTRCLS